MSRERRIVSVFFPTLAMDRWRVTARRERTLPGDDRPVVLARDGTHGPVIHALSGGAAARGIQPCTRVVDAQAVHPDLHVEPADPQGDIALLDRLALWSRRWCPWSARDGEDGILLDTTGAAHLFGGEAALLTEIARRFMLQGLAARPAMAPTAGAAWALARHGPDRACPEDVAEALAPLPVAALRIGAETERLLHRLGLRTVGALAGVARVALMRRFGREAAAGNPLIRLDQVTGRLPEPLAAPPDPGRFLARARLAEPVMEIAPHLPALAGSLAAALTGAGRGARRLRLTVYRIDGEWRAAEVATARASRDPAHLARLFEGRLEKVDPGFGFDLLTLEATMTEPLALRQAELGGGRDAEAGLAALLDRLTARLGAGRVTWPGWTESHLPERVEGRVPAIGADPAAPPALLRERPVRRLDPAEQIEVLYAVPEGPPVRFRWRRVEYRTARHAGPERIAPEWWRDRPGTRLRDYYKVEVEGGRRFWLYREGLVGDGRGGPPRWFLHGLFA